MKISTLGIFFLILLEYACFPISSEIVLPFAGGVAAGTKTPFPLLLLGSVAAGLIGTSITYAIGRYGGSPLLDRLMKRFPKTASPILASYRFFGDHGRSAVCIGRVIPICRTYIAFVAGAALTPFSSFLIFSSIGIGIWNLVLLSIGYYFYQYRLLIPGFYQKYKLFILIAAATFLVLFLFNRFTKTQDD